MNGLSGKMGSSVLEISRNQPDIAILKRNEIITADVVIDFSRPDSAMKVLDQCVALKKPIIIGTTGFDSNDLQAIKDASKEIPLLISYNMSKGIFFLKKSIKDFLSNNISNISCLIEEVHHTEKVDSPSGTAIELKKMIEDNSHNKNILLLDICSSRVKDVFGIHKITFSNDQGVTEFKHEALSRNIFANGAIDIAKLIIGKDPGLYDLEDFFNTK